MEVHGGNSPSHGLCLLSGHGDEVAGDRAGYGDDRDSVGAAAGGDRGVAGRRGVDAAAAERDQPTGEVREPAAASTAGSAGNGVAGTGGAGPLLGAGAVCADAVIIRGPGSITCGVETFTGRDGGSTLAISGATGGATGGATFFFGAGVGAVTGLAAAVFGGSTAA